MATLTPDEARQLKGAVLDAPSGDPAPGVPWIYWVAPSPDDLLDWMNLPPRARPGTVVVASLADGQLDVWGLVF